MRRRRALGVLVLVALGTGVWAEQAKPAPAAAAAPVILQAHAEYSMAAVFPPETPLPRMGPLWHCPFLAARPSYLK